MVGWLVGWLDAAVAHQRTCHATLGRWTPAGLLATAQGVFTFIPVVSAAGAPPWTVTDVMFNDASIFPAVNAASNIWCVSDDNVFVWPFHCVCGFFFRSPRCCEDCGVGDTRMFALTGDECIGLTTLHIQFQARDSLGW